MESRFAFVDCLTLTVRGGRGGNGIVSFRREAFVPKGGPDGGDGGDGGSVALLVDAHLSTLADLSRRRVFTAPAGTSGGPSGMTGARGHDLVIRVPQGTQVYDEGTGELLADLASDGASLVVARGGEAGRGNAAFATPTRRAPRFATRGGAGEERRLRLELKLIASVGLLGLPNAGKSSLLRAVTSSRARVGAYPFTTLHPGLGVVETSPGRSFVIADLPGLIEGASAGAGLGLGFLRHAERTRVLAMLVAPDLQESPARQLELLEGELAVYSGGGAFSSRPRLVVLTKCDLLGSGELDELLAALPEGAVAVSSHAGTGLDALIDRFWEILRSLGDSEPGH